LAAAPGRHDHAVGDGQGTEVADPQPPLLDGAAEEPAVDADLGPATVDERAGGLEIGLPSPVAVGPGGRHAHAGPMTSRIATGHRCLFMPFSFGFPPWKWPPQTRRTNIRGKIRTGAN